MELMKHAAATQIDRRTRLVVTPHPFTTQGQTSVVVTMAEGETLASILYSAGADSSWVVELDGLRVPALMWGHTRVKHGVVIECRRTVHGNDTLRIVALATLAYFTLGTGNAWLVGAGSLTGAAGFAAYAVGVAAFYAGSMVINQVLPVAKAGMYDTATNSAAPTYSLSGGRNSARLWEPMSLVLGQPYVVPDLAGQPWTFFAGEDQYLTQIFHAGINVQRVDSLRIGQTDLADYANIELRQSGLAESTWSSSLPANSVDSIAGGLLDAPSGNGAWVTRTTSTGTIAIGIDLDFSLFGINSQTGAYESRSVVLEAQYKPVDSASWTTIGGTSYSNASSKPLRTSINVPVASGQYDVRLRKLTTNETSASAQNTATWQQLKSFQPDLTTYAGQALVALTIKASGQLSGNLDQLNWVATAKPMPYWNGSEWTTATSKASGLSNPGAIMLQFIRGIYDGNSKLIAGLGWPDSRIDVESFKDFMVWCAAKNFTFDAVIQQAMNNTDLLEAVAYAGMGSLSQPGGKLGVQWLADDAPVEGVINMGNIKARSFSVNYAQGDRADEIEYSYFDASINHQWNSLRVKSPAVDTPTNTARLSNMGITSEAQAAILARYAMAQNIYMHKAITFEQDMEFLTYRRGTVLALSHDLTQWGFSGRVQSVSQTGGVVTLGLDDEITPPTSGSAYIGLRLVGEMQYRVFTAASFTAPSRTITLQSTWPAGVPLPGTNGQPMDALWIYDFKATPGQRVVVSKIEPSDNQGGARVTVAPLPDEFWPYVLNGQYTPAPNRSLLAKLPTASGLQVYEELQRQGSTYYSTLTAQFLVNSAYSSAEVWGGVNGGALQLLGTTESLSFNWRGNLAETWSIEVRPKNSLGQFGTTAFATYAVQGFLAPPINVSSLQLVATTNGIRATWAQCTDIDYAETVIRQGSSFSAGVDVVRKSATSHLLGWQTSGVFSIWAKHVDTSGKESATASQAVITIENPKQATFARFDVIVNTVAIAWADCTTTQPIKSYAIYTGAMGDTLSQCALYGKAGSDSRSDVVIFRSAGQKRIYLVAEDLAGNLSSGSFIDVQISLPNNFVLSSEWDSTFNGTITNSTLMDGELWMFATPQTWGDHFSSNSYTNIQDQVNAGMLKYFQPSPATAAYQEVHDIGKTLGTAKVSVSVQMQVLSGTADVAMQIEWSANGTTWTAGEADSYDVQATNLRYVRITYTATSTGGDELLLVKKMHATVSSEEKSEYGAIMLSASDANGTAFTTTKGFFDVVSAVFTPKGTSITSPSAIKRWSVWIDDQDSPTTPAKVYVMGFDDAGNRVSGSGSLQIGGY